MLLLQTVILPPAVRLSAFSFVATIAVIVVMSSVLLTLLTSSRLTKMRNSTQKVLRHALVTSAGVPTNGGRRVELIV